MPALVLARTLLARRVLAGTVLTLGMLTGRAARSSTWVVLDEWLEQWSKDRDEIMGRVTTQVECAEYFPQRDDALRAHATQIDPNGMFFAVPLEWQQRLWPTEEYELALSHVETDDDEDDLFAGIDPTTTPRK